MTNIVKLENPRRGQEEGSNDFIFFKGSMPKQYEEFVVGIPRPVQVIERGERFGAKVYNGGSYHEGPLYSDKTFDDKLADSLFGEACAQLIERAKEQGFNALFDSHIVAKKFGSENRNKNPGVSVGWDIYRSCTLVAEGMGYKLRLPSEE